MDGPPLRTTGARLGALVLALTLLAAPAAPTWSVVAVDTATGEVCIASATCLAIDLEAGLAVVQVGRGAAAAQSAIDTQGTNRQLIWEYMAAGKAPATIRAALEASDPAYQTRQYGIVDFENVPRSWHGTGVGGAKRSISGTIGTIRYAIQGNLLTGFGILGQARTTFETTDGDLSQRVMAAMDHARDLGGDGRCSCNPSFPQSCGVPPPDFDRAALSAFLVLARMGDTDGVCNVQQGCANGDYFLDMQFIGPEPGVPDPVDRLTAAYLEWRVSRLGRPDHVKSRVIADETTLPADGVAGTTVQVELRDLEGLPVQRGGFPLYVEEVGDGPRLTRVGSVLDHGDGTYSFKVRAGFVPGAVRYAITVEDEGESVLLYPGVSLRLTQADSGGLGD